MSNELNDVREWIESNSLALLVFTTPDCGVCTALKPRVAQLGDEHPSLRIRYVDAEAEPEVAGQFNVFAVPVYILHVQGREAVRFARHFGMGELEAAVARYSGLLGGQ